MGLISGVRATLLPSKGLNINQPDRVDDYGNLFTLQGLPAGLTAALEGSLFVARHTPVVGGTGVALGIATSFVDTTPALVLTNGESAGGKTYLPLYIRARLTAAGASSTSAEISCEVDNSNRYVSGGTALTSTINATNAAALNPISTSTASLVVGAITAGAAGTRRRFVGSAVAKIAASPLWIVQDVITLTFGGAPTFVQQAQVVMSDAATPAVTGHVPMPACAVPPGGSFVLNWANIANAVTPPSVEFEMAWIER